MKTNEEKLKQLLTIAVKNGWNVHLEQFIDESFRVWCLDDNFYTYSINKQSQSPKSLNDLVTNFEPNEVSFIEALCNASTKDSTSSLFSDENTHKLEDFYLDEKLRMIWTLQPTSQRLQWLFDTFSHLL